jgi:uncharacterized protein YecE (DUF72 family)
MTKRPSDENAVKSGPIRIGIGGWDFAPWRGLFYPPGLELSQNWS